MPDSPLTVSWHQHFTFFLSNCKSCHILVFQFQSRSRWAALLLESAYVCAEAVQCFHDEHLRQKEALLSVKEKWKTHRRCLLKEQNCCLDCFSASGSWLLHIVLNRQVLNLLLWSLIICQSLDGCCWLKSLVWGCCCFEETFVLMDYWDLRYLVRMWSHLMTRWGGCPDWVCFHSSHSVAGGCSLH